MKWTYHLENGSGFSELKVVRGASSAAVPRTPAFSRENQGLEVNLFRLEPILNNYLDLLSIFAILFLIYAGPNIVSFIKEVSLSFRELAQNRNITFKVISGHESLNVY